MDSIDKLPEPAEVEHPQKVEARRINLATRQARRLKQKAKEGANKKGGRKGGQGWATGCMGWVWLGTQGAPATTVVCPHIILAGAISTASKMTERFKGILVKEGTCMKRSKMDKKTKRFNILMAASHKKSKLEERSIELAPASEDTKMLTTRDKKFDPKAAC